MKESNNPMKLIFMTLYDISDHKYKNKFPYSKIFNDNIHNYIVMKFFLDSSLYLMCIKIKNILANELHLKAIEPFDIKNITIQSYKKTLTIVQYITRLFLV